MIGPNHRRLNCNLTHILSIIENSNFFKIKSTITYPKKRVQPQQQIWAARFDWKQNKFEFMSTSRLLQSNPSANWTPNNHGTWEVPYLICSLVEMSFLKSIWISKVILLVIYMLLKYKSICHFFSFFHSQWSFIE